MRDEHCLYVLYISLHGSFQETTWKLLVNNTESTDW